MSVTDTFGYQHNNPLNLRPLANGQMWHGQTGVLSGFCTFSDPRYCFRAWLMECHSYQATWGCQHVWDYIVHYAPAADDNDPVTYTHEVEDYMHLPRGSAFSLEDRKLDFCKGQMSVEIGGVPYDDELILEGFSWVTTH